jgi:hypothetical protein
MYVKKGQSWGRAIFSMDRGGLYTTKKRHIGINLIPVVSQ